MARPTKLTPETAEKIRLAIGGGNYREVAAEWAGISVRSFNNWMLRGEKAKAGVYREFFLSVIEAERQAEINAVRLIMAAAANDPKHAEWWLERKNHERWGRKDQLTLNMQRKSDDELRAIVAGAIGADGGGDPGIAETESADPAALPAPEPPASE